MPWQNPAVTFIITTVNIMVWYGFNCAVSHVSQSPFCNLYSSCDVCLPPATHRVSNQFPLLTPAEMKYWFPDEFRGQCFAWCHLSAPRFLPTGNQTTPHPPRQSRNMVISHSCCVKLVFLCGCDKHMVFCKERSLKTYKRDEPLFLFFNPENIPLSQFSYIMNDFWPLIDYKQINETLP